MIAASLPPLHHRRPRAAAILITSASCEKDPIVIPEDNIPATLYSLDIALDKATVDVGNSTIMNITAVWSDGKITDVTEEASITSADEKIAAINGNSVKGCSAGSAIITATYMDKSSDVTLVVKDDSAPTPPSASALSVHLNPKSISKGETTTIAVMMSMNNGSHVDVTKMASIKIKDSKIASIKGNVITGLEYGQTQIEVTYHELTVSTYLTVAPAQPDIKGLSISLSKSSVALKEIVKINVIALMADDSTKDVTGEAKIECDNGLSFTGYLDGSALYTANATGTVIVTAKYLGLSAKASVSVTK